MINVLKSIFSLALMSLCCLGSAYASSKEAEDDYFILNQDNNYQKAFKHYHGLDVSKNYTKAAAYYQKAVDLGDTDGYSGLGGLYLLKGAPNKALEYYQKACKKGGDQVDCEEADTLKHQLSLKHE